jgi:hypothetical protein
MRENLTYGLKWQGVETRTWSQAPLPDPTSRRAAGNSRLNEHRVRRSRLSGRALGGARIVHEETEQCRSDSGP